MTNAKQVYRRMSDDLRGPIYACQEESTLHVLRDCDFVKGIWKAAYGNSLRFWNSRLSEWKCSTKKKKKKSESSCYDHCDHLQETHITSDIAHSLKK